MSLLEKASLILTPNAVKASKLYSIVPSTGNGDMDVVRATTATRVNSLGLIENVASNVARLNYDGSCPSILLEPQRTNLFLRSEEFDNTYWVKSNGTVSLVNFVSPNSSLTSNKFIPNTSISSHRLENTALTSLSGTVTFSVFAKSNGYNLFILRLSDFGLPIYFNLTNGTIIGSESGVTSVIKDFGNGWYRCSITANVTNNTVVRFQISQDDLLTTFAGDNVKGILFYGAQLEQGAYPTSYIPTVASTVTRNADVISKTGISDLIGQTEGVMYWEGYIDLSKSNYGYFPRLFTIGNGTETNFACLLLTSTNILQTRFQISGANQAILSYSIPTSGFYKIAYAYKQNDFVLYVNGVNRENYNLGNVMGFSNVYLGREIGDSSTPVSHPIKSAILWKERLTNTELAQLTTI